MVHPVAPPSDDLPPCPPGTGSATSWRADAKERMFTREDLCEELDKHRDDFGKAIRAIIREELDGLTSLLIAHGRSANSLAGSDSNTRYTSAGTLPRFPSSASRGVG